LKLSVTQTAKVGEAVSWLLQVQTPLTTGENGSRPKHERDASEIAEAITARLTRKVL